MREDKNSGFVDIHALLKQYLSKWYWFVISVVLCVGAGYLYCRKYPQKIAVRANLMIQQEDSNPMMDGGLGSLLGSKGYVEDEVFVIASHSLYRNVVKELGINCTHYVKDGFMKGHLAYPDFPVDIVGPGIADTLSTPITFVVKVDKDGLTDVTAKAKKKTIGKAENQRMPFVLSTPYGDFEVVATPEYKKGKSLKTTIYFNSYDSAAEGLSLLVGSGRGSKKSNVISLSVDTPNPEYGVAILNKIIEKYNERGVNEKNQQAHKTAEFLKDRIALLARDLNVSETEIQQYKESKGVVDLAAEATYQAGKKGQMETALFNIEKEIELLHLTRDFLSDSLNYTELIPASVANGGVQNGISAYNSLVLKRLELTQNAKPDNYALRQLTKQMDLVRKNLLMTSAKAIETANISLRDLQNQKSLAVSKLSNIPSQEKEFINLKRQQEIKQEIYVFLLQKQEENAMLLANAVPKGQIVDEAFTLAEPLGASKWAILAVAFMAGLIFPPILLFMIKLLKNKFESRDEAEKYLSAPILGEMCINRSGKNLVVSRTDTSSVTELFRLIRTNLLFMLGSSNGKVVLMTSTRSGEGKSFIAINLAATLSLIDGKRVLLVGMDIRNPQLANYLGIPSSEGLTNYLSSNDVSLDSVIMPMPSIDNCDLILAGPIPPNPAELLLSDKIDRMFETLRQKYDYIIVDSAPVGMVSDTFTLSRISDMTIYVTRINYSTFTDLKFAEKIYNEDRLKNMSVVINGTSSKKGYGYGYGRKQ